MTAIIKSVSAFVVMSLVMGAFLTMIPVVSATNDPPNDQATHNLYVPWNVTDTRSYTGGTDIWMWNNNLTVKNGGKLTLDHSTLRFQNHGLIVESGGTFIMKNGSLITGFNGQSYYCAFLPGSKITLADSTIKDTAGSTKNSPDTGIYFGSDNATSDHMLLQSVVYNTETVRVGGKNVIFRNSTIEAYHFNAMQVDGQAYIYDSLIQQNGPYSRYGVVVPSGGKVTLVGDTIKNIGSYGIILTNGTGTFSKNTFTGLSVGVYAEFSSSVNVMDNTFTGPGYAGVYLDQATGHIAKNTIKGTTVGIAANYKSSADLEGNIIRDCNQGISVWMNEHMNLTKSNKIFNSSWVGIWAVWSHINSTGTEIYNSSWMQGSIY
jgi:hypothetical protein